MWQKGHEQEKAGDEVCHNCYVVAGEHHDMDDASRTKIVLEFFSERLLRANHQSAQERCVRIGNERLHTQEECIFKRKKILLDNIPFPARDKLELRIDHLVKDVVL